MSKMTASQILEVLKKETTVEQFANDFDDFDIEDFSEEALNSQAIKDEIYQHLTSIAATDPEHDEVKKHYYETPSKWEVERTKFKNKLGLGEFSQIKQYGGEGMGDNWWSIIHFKDHDVYLKVHGHYASYHGVDFYGWDDVREVRPQEKTVTVYE